MTQENVGTLLKRRLVSGGIWAFGAKLATAVVLLASNALLARLLSPQDVGAYFLAFSLVSLGSWLGSMGLDKVSVRFIAETTGSGQFERTRQVAELVCKLGALGALGVGILYLSFVPLLGMELFHAPSLATASWLVAAWVLVVSPQRILAEVFRGFHDIRLAATFEGSGLVTGALFTLCLILIWFIRGRAALDTVILFAVGSALASLILASWMLRRKITSLPRPKPGSFEGIGRTLHIAWPLLLTNVTLFAITQADLWIVGAFRPQEEVAIYGAAAKLVILVAMPLYIVNSVVPPLIADMYAQGKKRQLERVLRAAATLSGVPAFLVLAGFILLGGPILGLAFGDYYRDGATVLALLSVGQLVYAWAGSCGLALMMTGHQMMMMVITVSCGSLSVVIGLMTVSQYGATAVAIAAAAGIALQNVLMWVGARLATGMWTHIGLSSVVELMRAARTNQ